MPFFDEFARSFTAAMSAAPSRSERRLREAQTGALQTETRLAEEAFPLEQERRRAETSHLEAQTATERERAREYEWKNSPEFRGAFINNLNAETTGILSRAGVDDQNARKIAHELSDAQVALANARTEADTAHANALAEQAYANAAALGADADKVREEVRTKRMEFLIGYGAAGNDLASVFGPEAVQSFIETGTMPSLSGGAAPTGAIPATATTAPPATRRQPITATAAPPASTGVTPPQAIPPSTAGTMARTPAPASATPGPTAGPATAPAAGPPAQPGVQRQMPSTPATQRQMPSAPATQGAMPTTTPPPYRAPATPQEPVSGTYTPRVAPSEAPTATPRPQTGVPEQISYRPGEGVGGNVIQAQAGTRRLPLNERTLTMLQEAGRAAGVDFRVTSGGQKPGKGAGRVGSTRHGIDVGAADGQLINPATGKPYNMSTPEGKAKFAEFVRAARAAGATGIGAGHGYMGDETIHVGFGSEAVWGAGGRGANAEGWLREAYFSATPGKPSGAIPEEGVASEATPEGERKRAPRMPTPRGEVSQANREAIVRDGVMAAKEGGKAALANAGLSITPTPAITDTGRQARLNGFVTGQGAADPRVVADAEAAIQQAMPPGTKISPAEKTLLSFAASYKWYAAQGDTDKAAAAAGELYQAYKQKYAQFGSLTQVAAQNGDMDKAAQLAARQYALVPDGKDAKFTKDKDGNYFVEISDVATKEKTFEQVLTPDQLFSNIMGWQGGVEFDRRMVQAGLPSGIERKLAEASGEALPSSEYILGTRELSQGYEAYPTVSPAAGQPAGFEPPVIIEPSMANVSQMPKEEAEKYLSARGQVVTNVENARKALQRPEGYTLAERDKLNEELARIKGIENGVDPVTGEAFSEDLRESVVLARNIFGQNLNGIYGEMLASHPDMNAEQIVHDLGSAVRATESRTSEQLPVTFTQGDYEGTWKTHFPGSPTSYNLPADIAMSIRNGLLYKQSTGAQAEVAGYGTTERDRIIAAEEAAAQGVVDTYKEKRARRTGDTRYRAPSYFGPMEGAIPMQRREQQLLRRRRR